jgi:CubicO group peptidase (beta-lactamase class C family)
MGAVGLELRTVDVARLGQTLLDGGRWRGQQLVPADYVAGLVSHPVDAVGHAPTGSAQPVAESARYGRGVWLCARDDAWRMDGVHGQLSVVLPDLGVCITTTAHYRGASDDILDAIWSDIVPVLR